MTKNGKMNLVADNLDFDIDFEEKLKNDIKESLIDLELLKEDKEKIGDPDAMGKVILEEVWKQFGNQIGLDMTNETLIQQYDREHPESYEEVGQKVMQDERYKTANKEMKQKQKEGTLKDEYTGKDLKQSDKANLDHTVSRKEIYENKRRRQANISTEDLANKDENLNATNESLNKSKGAKSVEEMVETRAEREQALREQNERANKKIDESNMSETEKRLAKEKNDKRFQDKLDADDELMKKKDAQARKAINRDIVKGVVKETGKKAGKDALKAMAVQALFELLKEVMNALIRFFKSAARTFKGFLEEMKIAVSNFFKKITTFIRNGAMTGVGTIVSEIFGRVVSLFTKLASVIKQGFRSLGDAVAYLKAKENRNKSFSIRVAEVGKIIVAGLVATGAIFGGEVFEKWLIAAFPPLGTIMLPLLGSLANVIGLFLASMISGVVGAIVLNLIDKAIANQQKSDNVYAQVEKGNDILSKQNALLEIKQKKIERTKKEVFDSMNDRSKKAREIMSETAEDMSESLKKIDISKKEIDRLLQSLSEE
ncbi:MAG: hypothetical protein J6M39_04725 [Lachnospiraceae bacterium]|nr:hypothetical protein [Lachnospiraceae bacterium]